MNANIRASYNDACAGQVNQSWVDMKKSEIFTQNFTEVNYTMGQTDYTDVRWTDAVPENSTFG